MAATARHRAAARACIMQPPDAERRWLEVANLKDRDLIVEAIVIDFVFKIIQPLKDWVYPAYMYTDTRDPSRVTERVITEEDFMC